jgi:hypothetical protein
VIVRPSTAHARRLVAPPAAIACCCGYDADGQRVAVADMPIVNALQGRTVRGAQLTLVHPTDGSRRTCRLYAAPVLNREGEIIAATCECRWAGARM